MKASDYFPGYILSLVVRDLRRTGAGAFRSIFGFYVIVRWFGREKP